MTARRAGGCRVPELMLVAVNLCFVSVFICRILSPLPDCAPILHAGFIYLACSPASNSLKPSCQESAFGINMWYGTDSFPKETFLIFYACDLFQCNFIVLKITLIFSKYLQDIMQIKRALWQNLGSLGS